MNVLFICGKNKLRSPTAEHVFAMDPGLFTDSAGVDADAEQVVSPEQARWADLIVVMEPAHRVKLQKRCRDALNGQRVVCLNIGDDYTYMQPELVEKLRETVEPHLLALASKASVRKTQEKAMRPRAALARNAAQAWGGEDDDDDFSDEPHVVPIKSQKIARKSRW